MFKKVKAWIQAIRLMASIRNQNPENLQEHYLSQIRNALEESYRANPRSKKKLMKEANQFGGSLWKVYKGVGIYPKDIEVIVDEVIGRDR